jgi:hypothetical protein
MHFISLYHILFCDIGEVLCFYFFLSDELKGRRELHDVKRKKTFIALKRENISRVTQGYPILKWLNI